MGRGKPTDRSGWPAAPAWRDWLEYCDRYRENGGRPSLRTIAGKMWSQGTRVNDILRGRGWPANDAQARGLLDALGAVGAEVDRGVRLYRAACAERDRAADHQAPGWWSRSGYPAWVAERAPIVLRDRQAELDELAAWCGGSESYVWWRGPAWAGKSALMAWFATHPPPGVWVVSFFVTAPLVSQSDSGAFTEAVLDQLCAIVGERAAGPHSLAQRDRVCRQLLAEAASRAARLGRRLVLLVDGLDEDRGAHPGSGVGSIASLLPKRPPDGLRVIVSGRPDPPIAADVDHDHPLRICPVRTLDPSPHSRAVEELARRELDELLGAYPDGREGLGFHVVGLVTACGGGLDGRDLQELTGRAAYEIDGLVAGVFGRTIAFRSVFLFTHERLLVEAVDRIGRGALAGFRDRIRSWAVSYERRGWPADTPMYLLVEYSRMLADIGDTAGLAALAVDAVRHDRMLEATGSDTAALEEIGEAQALVCAETKPDMLTALRLARHSDRLIGRNTYIPPNLPAAWAAVGSPVHAEALARSIAERLARAAALASLTSVAAAAGDRERAGRLAVEAEAVARSVADPSRRARALVDAARAAAAARAFSSAESIGRSIDDPVQRGRALDAVASALVDAGDLARAEELASSTWALVRVASAAAGAGDLARATALTASAEASARSTMLQDDYVFGLLQVAAAAVATGDLRRATELTTEAATKARRVGDPLRAAWALAEVVSAEVAIGDLDRAASLVAEVEARARNITPGWGSTYADSRVAVVSALVAANEFKRAVQVAEAIDDPVQRGRALVTVVSAAVTRRDLRQAESIARSITDPYSRSWALAVLASAAADEDLPHATDIVREAEAIARRIIDPHSERQALNALVSAVASVGEFDRAETIARSTSDPDAREGALHDLAWALADAGALDRAETIARSITKPSTRSYALKKVVSTAAAVGDLERAGSAAATEPRARAEALAVVVSAALTAGDLDRAETVARTIADPPVKTAALARVAVTANTAGDFQQAARLAAEVEAAAGTITEPYHAAYALPDLISAAAVTRRLPRVAELIAEAESVSRRMVNEPGGGSHFLSRVVTATIEAGDLLRAAETARLITNKTWRTRSLIDVLSAADDAHAAELAEEAETVARSEYDPSRRTRELVEVAAAGRARHDPERAARLLGEAEATARSITDPSMRGSALAVVASAMADAGDRRRAELVARSIDHPSSRTEALISLAETAAAPRARVLLAAALVSGRWTEPLRTISRTDPSAVRLIADEVTS